MLDPSHSQRMTEKNFPRTFRIVQEGLQTQVASAIAVGVCSLKEGSDLWTMAKGFTRTIPTRGQPISENSLFDLASLTKIFSTTTLLGLLRSRKWITFEDPYCKYFPEFPHKEVTLKHLMTHTSGHSAWKPFYMDLVEKFSPTPIWAIAPQYRQTAMRELLFKEPLENPAGSVCKYSDITMMLLGFLIENLLDHSLPDVFEEQVARPLGLKKTVFIPIREPAHVGVRSDIVATEKSVWRNALLQGQVNDDNTWAMGGWAGQAGLFSTIPETLRWAQALFAGFLPREVLTELWTKPDQPANCERLLGWDTASRTQPSCGKYFSPSTVGHLGFTGTSLWIDLDAQLAVALFTNRIHPTIDNLKIREFRPKLHDAVRMDLR